MAGQTEGLRPLFFVFLFLPGAINASIGVLSSKLLTTGFSRLKPTRIVLLLLLVMVAREMSPARDATGRIFGTVDDQQGAVIPAAPSQSQSRTLAQRP